MVFRHSDRNKNINRSFRKLDVWKEAVELYVFVKTHIRSLEKIPFKVRAQIEDSIFSCHSNIAEGSSRRSLKENIQFNNIALSTLAENYSQIYALFSGGDIDETWFNEFDARHYSLENKLISLNKAQISALNENKDWRNDYIPKKD